MLGAGRGSELVASTLHLIGGLHGAWVHIVAADPIGGVLVSLTVAACILILAGAVALSEVIRVKVRRYVLRHEERSLPEQRDKRGHDA